MDRTAPTVRPRWPVVAVLLLLVVTRAILWVAYTPPVSDVPWYAQYGFEQQLAHARAQSLYQVHSQLAQNQAFYQTVRVHRFADDTGEVEYPPLALALLGAPTRLLAPMPRITAPGWESMTERYRLLFRTLMLLFDAAALGAALVLLRRLYRGDTLRLAAWAAGGALLFPVLYDRIDVIVAALVAVSLALLVSGVPWVASFAVLALAINVKLVPVILAPLWLLGSLDERARARPLLALAGRALALAALTATVFLPFYLRDGAVTLSFLRFHSTRSVQVESLWASLELFLAAGGLPVQVVHEHGAFSLLSPLAPLLAAASPVVIALVLTALYLRAAQALLRGAAAPGRLAVRFGPELAGYALLALWAAMAASKVFSPQYLVWLVPLAPLAPLAGRARAWFLGGFALVCALTTAIFPYGYAAVLGAVGEGQFTRPTTGGALLLLARNGLFVALAVALARRLGALGRQCAGAGGHDAPISASSDG